MVSISTAFGDVDGHVPLVAIVDRRNASVSASPRRRPTDRTSGVPSGFGRGAARVPMAASRMARPSLSVLSRYFHTPGAVSRPAVRSMCRRHCPAALRSRLASPQFGRISCTRCRTPPGPCQRATSSICSRTTGAASGLRSFDQLVVLGTHDHRGGRVDVGGEDRLGDRCRGRGGGAASPPSPGWTPAGEGASRGRPPTPSSTRTASRRPPRGLPHPPPPRAAAR